MSELRLTGHTEPTDNSDVDPADQADSRELVEQAKTDPDAFGRLFDKHYERILNYTFRCTMNTALAEDLTSTTFLKALDALPRYRHRVHFSAWLYRIATNEVRMHWRSQRRRKSVPIDSRCAGGGGTIYFESPDCERDEALREKRREFASLHRAVTKLPDRYREVIVLRYFEGLEYREIADVLGKRMGTIKSLLHRALPKLKAVLLQDASFRDGHQSILDP